MDTQDHRDPAVGVRDCELVGTWVVADEPFAQIVEADAKRGDGSFRGGLDPLAGIGHLEDECSIAPTAGGEAKADAIKAGGAITAGTVWLAR